MNRKDWLLLATLLGASPVLAQEVPGREPGLTVRVYQVEGEHARVPALAADQTPNVDRLVPTLDLGEGDFGGLPAPIVTHAVGWLHVERAGGYRLRVTSDDGSLVSLDGRLVIDHDGTHGATAVTSRTLELEAGDHALLVRHFDHGGARALRLEWSPPGSEAFEPVPSSALRAETDPTRVTSPGPKRVVQDRRPGDGAPLDSVHPGWELVPLRPDGFEPKVGALAFLPDGRLVVGTFDPLQRDEVSLPDIESKEPDGLWALDVTGGPEDAAPVRVATDLYEPSGLTVVDGELYVAHRRAVTRLLDRDADGFFETHEVVGEGWEGWNYHQFAFGLVHRDGKLYTALSTTMAPPGWEGMKTNAGPNGPLRGAILEIDLETNDVRAIASGTRTPNGLGLLDDGTLVYLDNQGSWMPTSQLAEVIPGRFYGHHNWTPFVPNLAERFPAGGHPTVYSDRSRTPAALYLPHNDVVNSPAQPLTIQGGPFAGQLLFAELTAGGIRRVFLERVNGVLQGALFRFAQGFECGWNRMAWGPDGALYLGGIGAGGNWNWRGTQFGLQRLRPTGVLAFEMLAVRALPGGFEVEFTKPVEPTWLADPRNYLVEQWRYEPTEVYGGPRLDLALLDVTAAVPAEDGRSVRLEIAGLETDACVQITCDPVSVDGEPIWSTEAWYTLQQLPREEWTVAGVGVGVLPPANAVPWIGAGHAPAMRFREGPERPANLTWEELRAAPPFVEVGGGSGDLLSNTSFGDCRLHVEWFCPPGGEGQRAANSGVYLQDRYEVQVLGTPAGDHALGADEAGAIYGVKAADRNASTGPGTWQAYDLEFRAPRFEDGAKVADARLTLWWNGVLVHDDVALEAPTGAARAAGEDASRPVQLGRLRLQDHGSDAEGPVRYRNLWIAPLDEAPASPGEWTRPFEDGTLAWAPRGGEASFALADGVLTGETRPNTPNSFFTSKEELGDFELLWEARIDPELNSGVQVRSRVLGGFEERTGALTGIQVEFDPSERAWSAGLYDERGRGWLHPLHTAPYARRAFRPGEWNRFRVVARGPVVRTWINGVPAAEVFDAEALSGHLGFQVHGVGAREGPLRVEWRDVRLRRLR